MAASLRTRTPHRPLGQLTVDGQIVLCDLISDTLASLHAIVVAHKVVLVSAATAIVEGLALARDNVIRETRETAAARSDVSRLTANLLGGLRIEDTVRPVRAVPLLVESHLLLAFYLLGRLTNEEPCPNLYAWATR